MAAHPSSSTAPGVQIHIADPPSDFVSSHALASKRVGESEVERVTRAIEQRRKERVVITHDVRVALLKDCRHIAKEKGYAIKSKITLDDLQAYRDKVHQSHEQQKTKHPVLYPVLRALGFRNQNEQLLRCLDKAEEVIHKSDSEYFHYMDFNAYYTKVESRWPWMRHGASVGLVYVFLFYLFSPIFFCHIVVDRGICPADERGWMAALYFASTTLSTVGYGDLHVSDNIWHQLAGIIYMIIANVTLIGAFAVCVDKAWNPLAEHHAKVVERVMGTKTVDEPLHKKLARLWMLRATELIGGFVILNLIGVFANRVFLWYEEEELETDWTWMTSFYWAIQTTTTIGYGDLDMPHNQRWFQIIYLVLSTYFVGNALGGLAGLRAELEEVRRKYAWGRREISKNLIDELQPEEHDDKIDQYEFVVASLVQLGKISSDDVEPIMDKFRMLAGDSGYITYTAATSNIGEATDQEIQDAIDEGQPKVPFTNKLIRAPSFLRTGGRLGTDQPWNIAEDTSDVNIEDGNKRGGKVMNQSNASTIEEASSEEECGGNVAGSVEI